MKVNRLASVKYDRTLSYGTCVELIDSPYYHKIALNFKLINICREVSKKI